jgi:hypothetical protein
MKGYPMKTGRFIFLFLLSATVAAGQEFRPLISDTNNPERKRLTRDIREYLKGSYTMSSSVSVMCGAATWLFLKGSLAMNDALSVTGMGVGGLGFTVSILPAIGTSMARIDLDKLGYYNDPENKLYRKVVAAQSLSIAVTLFGLTATGMAIYGMVNKSDLIYGISMGSMVLCTLVSISVPVLVGDAIKILNEKGIPPPSFNLSPGGITLNVHFR